MPKEIPISTPLKSQRYADKATTASLGQIHGKHDVIVWLEVCELAPSGDYLPVTVDREDETPCNGTFLLHQGIQRRIRMTLINEADDDVVWKEIRELVVGRVRSDPEISDTFDDDDDDSILSLSLFPGEYLPPLGSRTVFRFEAAWDTSLHNSDLLNRVTPSGEHVFLTLSAYVDVSSCCPASAMRVASRVFSAEQMEKCSQPAVITKDICVVVCGRDSSRIFPVGSHARSLKQMIAGAFRSDNVNRLRYSVIPLVCKLTGCLLLLCLHHQRNSRADPEESSGHRESRAPKASEASSRHVIHLRKRRRELERMAGQSPDVTPLPLP